MLEEGFGVWVQALHAEIQHEKERERTDQENRIRTVVHMAEQERGRQVRLALVYQRLRSTQDLYTIVFSRTLDLVKLGKDKLGHCACLETLRTTGRNGGYVPMAMKDDELFAINEQLVLGWPYETVLQRIESTTVRPLALTFCTPRAVMALQTDKNFVGLENKLHQLERKYHNMLEAQERVFEAQEMKFGEQEKKLLLLQQDLSRAMHGTASPLRVVVQRPTLVSPKQLVQSPQSMPLPASPSFADCTPPASDRPPSSFMPATPPPGTERPESSLMPSTPPPGVEQDNDEEYEGYESERAASPPPPMRLRSRSRSAPDLTNLPASARDGETNGWSGGRWDREVVPTTRRRKRSVYHRSAHAELDVAPRATTLVPVASVVPAVLDATPAAPPAVPPLSPLSALGSGRPRSRARSQGPRPASQNMLEQVQALEEI
jgi:hypothetical protein